MREMRLSGTGMLYLVGVELTKGASKCEVDFIILLQDAELPAVIIGEAKPGHPDHPAPARLLSSDDIGTLRLLQDAFRALGIDCWICFATTRPALEQSEIDLLRRSCERALTPVFDFKGSLLPVLPIVLAGEDLSVPAFDEHHPARRVHGHFPRLPALARTHASDSSGWRTSTTQGTATVHGGQGRSGPSKPQTNGA